MNTLTSKEGSIVPSVVFKLRENDSWTSRSTDEIFGNRTVVVFSLPGAFTPTCSSTHVPRFNELAGTFKENGVDEIICMSVNDPFVMDAWAKDQQAEHISFIADGNGTFTQQMGLLVDKEDLNFGKRSWRYSMLVKNGVIQKMFIEPQEPGDPFKVSDADTMLDYINPEAKKPKAIVLFTKEGCGFCKKAKEALNASKMPYVEISLNNKIRGTTLAALKLNATVPQLFADGVQIDGSDAIVQWVQTQE